MQGFCIPLLWRTWWRAVSSWAPWPCSPFCAPASTLSAEPEKNNSSLHEKMVKINLRQRSLTTLSKSASSIVEELLDAIETAESLLPPLPFTLSSSWLFCELNLDVTVLKNISVNTGVSDYIWCFCWISEFWYFFVFKNVSENTRVDLIRKKHQRLSWVSDVLCVLKNISENPGVHAPAVP